MSALCDSSVLIAALLPNEDHHAACALLLSETDSSVVHVHALNETFATLTGGSLGFRMDAQLAARLIRERIVVRASMIALEANAVTHALDQARAHGVRGGAVYDYMYMVAARKAQADILYTLNLADFHSLKREGDPEILRP